MFPAKIPVAGSSGRIGSQLNFRLTTSAVLSALAMLPVFLPQPLLPLALSPAQAAPGSRDGRPGSSPSSRGSSPSSRSSSPSSPSNMPMQPKAAEPMTMGWTFTQYSRLSGLQKVKITPRNAKVECPKTGQTMILTGPPWKVTFFLDRSKSIYTTDFVNLPKAIDEGVLGPDHQDMVAGSKIELKNVPPNPSVIAGLPTVEFGMKDRVQQSMAMTASVAFSSKHHSGENDTLDQRPLSEMHLWAARDLKVDPAVEIFLAILRRHPDVPFVPLKAVAVDTKGRDITILDTFNCKQAAISDSEFELPRGYSQAADFHDLIYGKQTQSQVVDMMRGINDGEATRAKRTH